MLNVTKMDCFWGGPIYPRYKCPAKDPICITSLGERPLWKDMLKLELTL